MNNKLKYTLIFAFAVIGCYYISNRIFKVNYSENDVVVVDSIKVNDSITIKEAFVVLGKNYKGVIEATVFSSAEHRYKNQGIVDYYYLRFHPDWFEKTISPRIKKKLNNGDRLSFELVERAKKAHQDNFQYCCHINDYPIVKEGLLFTRISLVGVPEKVTMINDLAKN